MDIIDIMLAKAMTPQGQTDIYVNKANKAAAKAAQAQEDAETAIATVTAAAEDIQDKKDAADALLETAQDVLETAQQAVINMPEVYTTTGQNTDGYMTQKAVTDALATKADTSSLNIYVTTTTMNNALAGKADTTYVDQKIASIPVVDSGSSSSSGVTNLGSENEGYIVIVGEDGNVTVGDTTEEELIEALLRAGIYRAKAALGLDINYQGKAFTRTQEALNKTMGSDFNAYPMYGGRMRCNVSNEGEILAFYGDDNYRDDGSNGQVMVYQPKFYYQRTPLKTENLIKGQVVRQESLIISAQKQAGFKLHPLFDDGEGGELDYVLLSAYDGSLVDGKLSSISGQQPASNMTINAAENYARARGNGWHIINMAAESASQMLQIIEYGTLNGQAALEEGISDLTAVTANINCGAITGSTASLGNATGHATTTVNNNNGVLVENTGAGKRAITYRGVENPWGNLWNFVGGINIKGDGNCDGGAPYICTDFDYTPSQIGSNYEYIGFNLPNTYGYINAMGYGDPKYDWVYMPIECATSANSALPVGDNLWIVAHVNENKIVVVGGTYTFKENDGLFYYGCDQHASVSATYNYGARLMFIPTKNTIYTNNISKWNLQMGG